MKKIMAISGIPGTGKTTLLKKFMEMYEWERVEPLKMLHALYCRKMNLFVLGKYEPDEIYSGTDTLGMNIQPVATEFVKTTKSNILFEGDRLTNCKFFDHILQLETDFSIIILSANKEIVQDRYKIRGSNQSEIFLKGRQTKINNITSNMTYFDCMSIVKNNTEEDQIGIIKSINDYFTL